MSKANFRGVQKGVEKDAQPPKPKVLFKYSEDEMKLIKTTFSDNDELLMVLKKIMLQLELTEAEEVAWLNTFKGKDELIRVLRKFFLPTLSDKNVDVHQMTDLWSAMEREINFRDRKVEDCLPHLLVAEAVIAYLDNQLKALAGELNDEGMKPFKDLVKVDSSKPLESYIGVLTRNLIFTRVEKVVMAIYGIAQIKDETPEQMAKRFAENSNK